MNTGRTIFAQLMDFAPRHEFNKCVRRHQGDYEARSFSFWDQFLAMAFAQLTYRESLRDIEACLQAVREKLYHLGIRGRVLRSTLAYANDQRDWRVYADFAQILIHTARDLYADDEFGIDLKNTVYALDASVIDLCLSLFPWAKFRKHKAAVKMHTLLDLRGNIPSFIEITEGKTHEVNILDILVMEAGSFYLMDRGYLDFGRLYRFTQACAFFVTRTKKNTRFRRLYSHPINRTTGVRSDQTIVLTGVNAHLTYPDKLRRVSYYDAINDKHLVFITNNFTLPALTIAELYRHRWQVELFFKWIKQHLRIKAFFGTSENAVKTQIWIAIAVYVIVAIAKKKLGLQHSLYTILQILSITLFEKTPILEAFSKFNYTSVQEYDSKQLNLFA